MYSRPGVPFKLFGAISLGLLTGVSYTLNNIAVPALLALPSAASAATAFAELNTRAVQTVRALAGVSAASFIAAYAFSPRSVRHPYLLWTTLIVAASGSFDLLLPRSKAGPSVAALKERARKEKRGKARLEASYEVLGDSTSEAGISDEGSDEDVNGEEVRSEMVAFKSAQAIRFYLSGAGFVMSLVGLWGDGSW